MTLGSLISRISTSFVNRDKRRPIGVTSKKLHGTRNMLITNISCTSTAARQQLVSSVKSKHILANPVKHTHVCFVC